MKISERLDKKLNINANFPTASLMTERKFNSDRAHIVKDSALFILEAVERQAIKHESETYVE